MSGLLARRARRRSDFDPTDISGCALWIDADDASTFSYSSGTVVSEWRDKSGNSRHVAPVSAAPSRNATHGSRTAVRFVSASSQALRTSSASTISQPWTVFYVAAISGATRSAARVICNRTTNTVQVLMGELSALGSLYAGTDFTQQGTVPTLDTLQQVSGVANGSSSQVWGNGSAGSTANAGSESIALATVGARGDGPQLYFNGDIAEVLIYSGALSTTDRQAVEAYLKSKWSTP